MACQVKGIIPLIINDLNNIEYLYNKIKTGNKKITWDIRKQIFSSPDWIPYLLTRREIIDLDIFKKVYEFTDTDCELLRLVDYFDDNLIPNFDFSYDWDTNDNN